MTLGDRIYFAGGRCDLCGGRIWFNFTRYWGALAPIGPFTTGGRVSDPFYAVHRKCHAQYRATASAKAELRPVASVITDQPVDAGAPADPSSTDPEQSNDATPKGLEPPATELDEPIWVSKPLMAAVTNSHPGCLGDLLMHICAQRLATRLDELHAWFSDVIRERCSEGGASTVTEQAARDWDSRIQQLSADLSAFSEECRRQVHQATGRDPAGALTTAELEEYLADDDEGSV